MLLFVCIPRASLAPPPSLKRNWIMESFFLEESYRSWRNFLNISQKEHWQFVKRSSWLWSLNTFASRKYLDELPFRNYIRERLVNAGMQLILKIPDLEKPIRIVSIEQELPLNCLGFLSLQCLRFHGTPANVLMKSLPSCDSLQSLFLDDCRSLVSLGEYKNLKTLKVRLCPNLLSAGKMDNLTTFYGNAVQRSFLQSISFDKLVSLILYYHIDHLLENISKFQNLRQLVVVIDVASTNFHLPQLTLPLLEKLTALNCLSIDVTGLYRLKSLDIGSTIASAVKGKEEILSRLTSLSGSDRAFLEEDIRNYPQLKSFSYQSMSLYAVFKLSQYKNIPEVNLSCKGSAENRVKFNFGPKTRSFMVNLYPVNIVVELGKSFCRFSHFNEPFDISKCPETVIDKLFTVN
jgi:hypothetical protein